MSSRSLGLLLGAVAAVFAYAADQTPESSSPSVPSAHAIASAPQPLSTRQKELFELGQALYIGVCGACHQLHGKGQEGLAPPLVNSEWVLGSQQRLIRIVLHGLGGPIHVRGKEYTYSMEMPGLAVLDDEQIAGLLTYVRREWGHAARPVDPATVAEVRLQTEGRETTWTEAELLQIP
jgi:mono/diheme cytochrome c family protein